MIYLKSFFFCCLFLVYGYAQDNYPQNYFEPPLKGKFLLSGTFGELRGNHFHAGIDIKTFQKVGLPVQVAASGYVSRIKVSPYGYGRAIYVQHPNGYTTVYGHLQKFAPELESYLKDEQYRLRKNSLNLYPQAGKFNVKQGDTIAFSGNSGGSGAPHLHFEIRDAQSKVLNPLFFGFDIEDNRIPVLKELATYTYRNQELVGFKRHRLVEITNGEYHLAGDGVLTFYGNPAFAIRAYDQLNNASNPNGYYLARLKINDSLVFDYRAHTFSFAETRYLNSHLDYAQYACCSKKFARLYTLPNNRFSEYQRSNPVENMQWLPDSTYAVTIEIADYAGNQATLSFKVQIQPTADDRLAAETRSEMPYFKYNQKNSYRDANVEVQVPKNALYENFYFETRQLPPCGKCLGMIYKVASRQIPVHRYYNLKLKLPPLNDIAPDKVGIVELNEKGEVAAFVGGKVQDTMISTQVRSFGTFAIMADTVPPVLEAVNLRSGKELSVMDELQFKVSDNMSGIEHYEAYWDEKWMRLYYDYKNNQLIFKADDIFTERGTHTLTLKVRDGRGNSTVNSYRVVW